jgi:arsenite-transporting ATPase
MYPEFTPIMEAWRASEDLKAQVGINTNFAIVNMLIPENYGNDAFFNSRRYQQQKYLPMIKEKFPIPQLFIPLFDHEPEGMENLRQLAKDVFSKNVSI